MRLRGYYVSGNNLFLLALSSFGDKPWTSRLQILDPAIERRASEKTVPCPLQASRGKSI